MIHISIVQGSFPYCVYLEPSQEIDCSCDDWETDDWESDDWEIDDWESDDWESDD